MTTWAQLTKYQQACLKSGINAGKVRPEETWAMDFAAFRNMVDSGLLEKKGRWYFPTPAGLAVWQQGQSASAPPRSVWVAMWHEYGEGDYLLSIHAQHETAQTACEVHAEQALKWEYAAGFDGMGEYRARVYDDDVLQGEYFVHEMPVLP